MIWPFCPLDQMLEGLQFSTDTLRAFARDTRIARTYIPRRMFNHQYAWTYEQFERARALLRGRLPGPFELPDWANGNLNVTASAGATSLNIDTTYGDYTIGGRAIIVKDCETYEGVTIDGISPTAIDLTTGLLNDYTNARVMPMHDADARTGLSYQRTVQPILPGSVEWTVYEGSDLAGDGGAPVYRTFPVLTQAACIGDGSLDGSVTYEHADVDNNIARPYVDTALAQPSQTYGTAWQPRTKQDSWALRRWFYYLRGKQKAFWLPDFNRGIQLQNDITIGAGTVTIKNVGFTSGFGTGDLFIKLLNGTSYRFQITGATDLGATEQLTISPVAPATVTISSVRTVCLMFLVKLASDRIEFQHRSIVGPRVVTAVEEVPIP